MKSRILFSIIAVAVFIGLASSGAMAGTIWTNSTYLVANTGGTVADPAVYVCDAFTYTWTNQYVGSSTVYNEMQIINGSAISLTYQFYLGDNTTLTGNYNSLLIDGKSSLTFNNSYKYFYLGYTGSYNNMTINAGSSLIGTQGNNRIYMGYTGSYNSILVNGGTINMARLHVGESTGSNNTVTVSNGGTFYNAGNDLTMGTGSGSNNTLTITGQGSTFIYSGGSSQYFKVGNSTGTGNAVIVEDGGVLQSTSTSTSAMITVTGTANYVGLAGGYIAYLSTSAGISGTIKVYDGTNWVAGVLNTNYWVTACSDAAAVATVLGDDYTEALGTSLAGYTIVSGGVPEPTTMAMLAIGGISVLVRRRRK